MKWAFFEVEWVIAFLYLEMELVRNRVVAVAAPGMATQNATYGQVKSFQSSVLLDGLNGILRTCRCETT